MLAQTRLHQLPQCRCRTAALTAQTHHPHWPSARLSVARQTHRA
jgi:hypothetical protein